MTERFEIPVQYQSERSDPGPLTSLQDWSDFNESTARPAEHVTGGCMLPDEIKTLGDGDVLSRHCLGETLELVSGETIRLDNEGGLVLFDSTGNRLSVKSKSSTPYGVMPEVNTTNFSGGVKVSASANRSIIHFPDGTEVHIDSGRFASVRREGRNSSATLEPDTFQGFK